MATFTDAMKQELVDKYLAAEPTPANSMDIVAELAEEYDHSVNGIRMFLSKATRPDGSSVYVKKDGAKPAAASKTASGDKAPRVSKEAAHSALKEAIEARGGAVDDEIIGKLTGKAAQYFTSVLTAETNED